MANTALKFITAAAKKLRKAKPSIKWSAAIKQASASYRATAKKAPTKTKAKKAKVAKVGRAKVRTINAKVGGDTLGSVYAKGKKILEDKLGKNEIKIFNSKNKTEKRKLLKAKSEISKALRKMNYGGNIKF